jgi:hypothetical protein
LVFLAMRCYSTSNEEDGFIRMNADNDLIISSPAGAHVILDGQNVTALKEQIDETTSALSSSLRAVSVVEDRLEFLESRLSSLEAFTSTSTSPPSSTTTARPSSSSSSSSSSTTSTTKSSSTTKTPTTTSGGQNKALS